MINLKNYKWPFISILTIIVVLMVMIAVGFTLGILSEAPDGLERALIDVKGESWLEGLSSVWNPILGWIDNDYIAGIIGVLLTVLIMMAVFTLISSHKKEEM